ncbi:hypothetical protein [Sulfurimonas sp.]
MHIKRILITLSLATLWAYSLQAATSAEKLFDAKCVACHLKVIPSDMSKLIAPPLNGVMRHVKMKYTTKEKAITFIRSYVLNPQKSKALCMPKSIQRFGLMPSQKGLVSSTELNEIAQWMYENYPQFQQMNSQKMTKKQNSPFLIISGLPHMTILIKNNWQSMELALTPKQKEKLLIVRKKTISGVRALKPKIMQLEKEIQKLTMNGDSLSIINPKVDKLAEYKAKLTKIQVVCIHNSKNILTPAQVAFLLHK